MFLEAATGRDADLLARFAATGDGAAFAELVRRHGPLARGVCERVCESGEADDAYQAVLIVLARKAGAVRDPGRLGPWIYGVAVRCALRARRSTRLRRKRESPMREMAARAVDADWSDVRPLLDAEVAALPEKLRAALVLCELQGVARPEAARKLGVPEGTLSSRLARAKDALRVRLVRRGVALSAGGVAATLGRAQVSGASVPAAGTPSAAAISLAELEVVMLPNLGLLKAALGVLTALGLTLAGIGLMPADRAKPDDVAAEKAKLKGEWVIADVKVEGEVDPTLKSIVGTVYTFTDNLFEVRGEKYSYIIRPDKSPKEMDFTSLERSEETTHCIYELSGDIFRIHSGRENSPHRPKDFTF